MNRRGFLKLLALAPIGAIAAKFVPKEVLTDADIARFNSGAMKRMKRLVEAYVNHWMPSGYALTMIADWDESGKRTVSYKPYDDFLPPSRQLLEWD